MATNIIISVSEEEFKDFLKQAIYSILKDLKFNTTQSESEQEIIDVKQAADFLHLKVSTLYEKTSDKTIPHFKKGKKLYFNKSELKEWVRIGKIKTNLEISNEANLFQKSKNNKR